MNEDRRIPLELLAPAGNNDLGRAAIDHGADAVYIGAPRFSARASAGNSMEDIARLIEYAHLFNARVYLALNTILSDSEIKEALPLIIDAYQAGADGLILQDMGLLELDLPPIPLIASTQMHNITPEKVKFLEDTGFSRVILARELSLCDIAAIREQTNIELECFVHGALCVSYSGQCYLSEAAFRRSGNRGVCAQPCRLKYTLNDGTGREIIANKHLLSLRDLNLVGHLTDLIDAGVTSFKIEGRYKDSAYVKNVTAAYRKALDRVIESYPGLKQQSSGHVEFRFKPDLGRTFNRSYTRYFLLDPDGIDHQAAMDTPKSTGTEVGSITQVGKGWFRLSGGAVHNGDGMCFISKAGVLKGFRVERVEDGRIVPNDMAGLAVGLKLFRNHDHEFLKLLDKPSAERKIGVSMTFRQTDDDIGLTVTDEDGHTVTSHLPATFDAARQPEKMRDQIRSQLTSTGNTIFMVTDLSMDIQWTGFIPVSLLNGLRREATDQLMTVRRLSYAPRKKPETTGPAPTYPEKILDYRANVYNRFARAFYLRHGAQVVERAFEAEKKPSGTILMTTRYCLRREIGACLKNPKHRLRLAPPLSLTDGKRTYRLGFDCKHCRMHVVSGN
ncbi:MAG: U32 family peptidase [Desulfobacterium sp.]|nr:U32 family peptidase [Desulfobacterium sp.]MBU3946712.1 U32 family peptidase [Pseudomonadota bacterium]MBU4037316.1 U32 family peptidase [Pseudomonadota bacterium]